MKILEIHVMSDMEKIVNNITPKQYKLLIDLFDKFEKYYGGLTDRQYALKEDFTLYYKNRLYSNEKYQD